MSQEGFSALEEMTYSGRGIIVGVTPAGNPFVGYSLTGRSPPSQARKLVYDQEHGVIRTDVTDRAQLERGSPALLIYPAVAWFGRGIVASNGAQTKLIFSEAKRNPSNPPEKILREAFSVPSFEYSQKEGWIDLSSYEPDAPNFTPRISACLIGSQAAMHIVRKAHDKLEVRFEIYHLNLAPREGRLVTTYKGGNESPLLPFDGLWPSPIVVDSDDSEAIVDSIYNAIHGGQNPSDNYRVSAAVMMIKNGDLQVAIRNRSEIGE